MIKAKFQCVSVGRVYCGQDHQTKEEKFEEEVVLRPASGDENRDWSKYTPSGELKMRITQEGAVGQFAPGKYYFLDFTLA